MAKFTVCVTDKRHESYELEREILSKIDAELKVCNCDTEEDIIAQCAEADGLLLDLAPMTAKAISGLNNCKVISRYGVGYNNVDIEACTAKNIQVAYVPDYHMEDVSDHTMALILACMRQLRSIDSGVRQGKWNIPTTCYRLKGKTVGLVGVGRIARVLVKKLSGFGLQEILGYDPYVSAEKLAEIGVRKVELDELVASSDIISLHLNLTEETRGIIGAKAIASMKPTALLINVSRGGLIDDEALVDALANKKIFGAGIDTHTVEPLGADSPFCKLDNVILTDHCAYNTFEGVKELKTKAVQNVVDCLMGKAPAYPLNKIF